MMPAIDHQVPIVSPAMTSPTADMTQVVNRLQRRSPMWSAQYQDSLVEDMLRRSKTNTQGLFAHPALCRPDLFLLLPRPHQCRLRRPDVAVGRALCPRLVC